MIRTVATAKPRLKKNPVLDKVSQSEYYVYILLLSNGHFYTGYTVDVKKRIQSHSLGKGSKCVRACPPLRVERVWTADSKSAAMKTEAYVKSLRRVEKEAFVKRPSLLGRAMSARGIAVSECVRYRMKSVESFLR